MNHRSIAVATVIALHSTIFADVVYDEALSGDLSASATSPTSLGVVSDPVLLVKGSVQAPVDVRDYFSITIPKGVSLDAMKLIDYYDGSSGGFGNTSYVMIDDGPTSVIPSSELRRRRGPCHTWGRCAPINGTPTMIPVPPPCANSTVCSR